VVAPKAKPTRRQAEGRAALDRTFIDERPQYIGNRERVGDAEADFIVSGKSGKGILLVVVDRKLRVTFIEQILKVSIKNMEQAFLRIKRRYPELRTITTDNDLLFAQHPRLERLLTVKYISAIPTTAGRRARSRMPTKSSAEICPRAVTFPNIRNGLCKASKRSSTEDLWIA